MNGCPAELASVAQPERFAEIFRRHFDGIYAFLARRLGPELADELAAEVFTRAFTARGRYDGAYSSARPWLFAIALDVAGRHRRAERRQLAVLSRLDRAAAPPADEGLASRVDARELAPAAARELARLRAADRDLLLLIAWAQLSYDDAAESLGVPVGTVRSRLHRTRTRLRSALEGRA